MVTLCKLFLCESQCAAQRLDSGNAPTIDHQPPDRDGPAREAIRPASRLLSEHELNLSAVRQALKDGEASGSADYRLNGLLEELDNEGATPLG